MSDLFKGIPEEVEKRTRLLAAMDMGEGKEYDPLERNNLREAIRESSDEQLDRLINVITSGKGSAYEAMKNLSVDYWFDYGCRIHLSGAHERYEAEQSDKKWRDMYPLILGRQAA